MLQQLSNEPIHGYEIRTRIVLCGDARPTDAMTSPILKELETGDYVEMESVVFNDRKRKNCSL
jgi:DNA-binding PadR family transcriptional regulator